MKRYLSIFLILLSVAFAYYLYVQKVFQPLTKVSVSSETFVIVDEAKSEILNIEPLSIDAIFSEHKDFNELKGKGLWTLTATGDVMLGRTVNYKTITYKNYKWAFEKVKPVLESSDITFINLETPLFENCPIKNNGMIFCASSQHTEGLKYAGIDIASVANNHAMNYGMQGFKDTSQILESAGIKSVGGETSGPQYIDANGTKAAFLAYDDIECIYGGISCIDETKIKSQIKESRDNKADVVIVMYHWGTEYTHAPSVRQKDIAHMTIDSGADLVLGNHPHWYQPVEIYNNKLIMYSHGNLVFDQMWSEKTREGVIGKYTFYKKYLIDAEFTPIYIQDFGQPEVLEGQRRDDVLKNLKEISL